jgi:putative flippase GtrA
VSQLLESEPLGGSEMSGGHSTTQPMMRVVQPLSPARSYHPTRFAIANRALDTVDHVTGGKAGWVQRLTTYLFIGGCAALVNLAVLRVFYYNIHWPASDTLRFIWASIWAYEISIFANFIPNDYVTFRHLAGHQRSWLARCLRFHITSIGGIIVTFAIAGALKFGFHVDAFIAQAIALIIAVFFNFSFHHIFTYRAQHAAQ